MKLLVGLGNPGPKYARNRHNVGFRVIDAIWQQHGGAAWRDRLHGQFAEIRFDGEKCLLLKPQTYMNESGRAVGAAMQFFKLQLEDVIVFYDEIDLAPGKLRIKTGGGVAGHNGLRSISAHVGNEYVRVRIGVGRPERKDQVSGYVLHDFAKSDETWLEPLVDSLAGSVDKFLAANYSGVMNDAALAVKAATGDDETDKARTVGKQAASAKMTTPEVPEKSKKSGGALADKLRDWLAGNKD